MTIKENNDESKKKDAATTTHKNSTLLRGFIFVLLRIANPPAWLVDYDPTELEALIKCHGGQILSLKLLEGLKAEHHQASQQQLLQHQQRRRRRTVHVLGWGAGIKLQQQQLALHPLLAQVRRKELCDIVTVTPNWLQTCVTEECIVQPNEFPLFFQPQTWSWRTMAPMRASDAEASKSQLCGKENSNGTNADKSCKAAGTKQDSECTTQSLLRISVTGFQGPQRTAMIHAIQAMGATYDDSLHQRKTTHLICSSTKDGSVVRRNQKFQKAQEWRIPAVSIEWLYHVLQHGRRGMTAASTSSSSTKPTDKANDGAGGDLLDGSESRFLMAALSSSN